MDDDLDEQFEVIDGLPVVAEVRVLAAARPPGAVLAQAAAVAATGFVAGIATAAMLGRRRQRQLARPPLGAGPLRAVSRRTYLVEVHLLDGRV